MEINIFKKSIYFKAVEQAAMMSESLVFRADCEKYDLDSDDGTT